MTDMRISWTMKRIINGREFYLSCVTGVFAWTSQRSHALLFATPDAAKTCFTAVVELAASAIGEGPKFQFNYDLDVSLIGFTEEAP
jgi:hypothetical protein